MCVFSSVHPEARRGGTHREVEALMKKDDDVRLGRQRTSRIARAVAANRRSDRVRRQTLETTTAATTPARVGNLACEMRSLADSAPYRLVEVFKIKIQALEG